MNNNNLSYKKFLLFLVIFIIIAALSNLAYKKYIYVLQDNGIKEQQLSELSYHVKYLFIGDSHIQNGINPKYFERAFNLAASNENYTLTFFKLKAISEKLNQTPEVIVMPIDISSFSSFRANRYKGVSDLVSFYDWLDLYETTGNTSYLFKFFIENMFAYSGQYIVINKAVPKLIFGNDQKFYNGFKPRNGVIEGKKNTIERCSKQADLYLRDYNYFDKTMVHYFKEILNYCTKNKIKVILVKLPLYKDYIEACRQYVPLEAYYDSIMQITNEFDNITILDYQNVFDSNGEYFRNPDHLNWEGAEAFSKLLSNDLQKLNL